MNTRHTWPALRVPLPHLPTANATTGLQRNQRVRPVVHRAQAAQIEEVSVKEIGQEAQGERLQTVWKRDRAAGRLIVKSSSKNNETPGQQEVVRGGQGRIATSTTDGKGLASWAVSVPQDGANGSHKSDNAATAPRRTKPARQLMPITMESRKPPVRKNGKGNLPLRYTSDIPAIPRPSKVRRYYSPGTTDTVVRASENVSVSATAHHSQHEGLELERIIGAIEDHLRHELLDGR